MLTIPEKDPYKKFFAAHIMTTSKCNLRCYYCYYPPKSGIDPPLEQIAHIIQEFEGIEETEVFYEVSGGEPMLRPDWYLLMKLFLDTGRDVVLNTNGTQISGQNVNRLVELYQKWIRPLSSVSSIISRASLRDNSVPDPRLMAYSAPRPNCRQTSGRDLLHSFSIPAFCIRQLQGTTAINEADLTISLTSSDGNSSVLLRMDL